MVILPLLTPYSDFCNGSYLSGWLGCDNSIATKEDLLAQQRANFGPNMPQSVVNQAVADTGQWLDDTHYTDTINQLKAQDSWFGGVGSSLNLSSYIPLLVAIGIVGIAAIGSGQARRYGR